MERGNRNFEGRRRGVKGSSQEGDGESEARGKN